ncbi:NXPE family member 4-like isoform X1 [Biomphalaria glabrata]|uniref:NXPE family member 4-like isoform X1 n=1 Tax=Biomphalaria glabrata TaxID=6526 RepID=A0A9U8EB33_BIOGL|nr:NXPE family member 4-like isoform X1 [Biomphalaria glabrata]
MYQCRYRNLQPCLLSSFLVLLCLSFWISLRSTCCTQDKILSSILRGSNVNVNFPPDQKPSSRRVSLGDLSTRDKKVTVNQTEKDKQQLSVRDILRLSLNTTQLLMVIGRNNKCADVAVDPRTFWSSPTEEDPNDVFTAEQDVHRMSLAIACGMLDWDYLSTPPVNELYSFEKFYLSRPPVIDVLSATSETFSTVLMLNPSRTLTLSEMIQLQIDVKDGRGVPKGFGGDEIRVWFQDKFMSGTSMSAKIEDLGNGTYIASAPASWIGTLRVHVAVTYSREYLRALVYLQLVLKSFRHIGALFKNEKASELTPCYHTEVIPGHSRSQICNMTTINGSPWFCGRPRKRQLDCELHFAGSRVIEGPSNIPATPAEMALFLRSSEANSTVFRLVPNDIQFNVVADASEKLFLQPKTACNEIPISETWDFESPTGFMYKNVWMPRHCHIGHLNTSYIYQDIEIILLGDSNGRSHYNKFVQGSSCVQVKKASTEAWHKPLLCVHEGNKFRLRWEPHTQPFMNGFKIAEIGSLNAASVEIDKIPSKGRYLVFLNHYFHITTAHISSIDYKYRAIRDALVRLFQRNSQVLVVLQSPHTSQVGWPKHYEAGDMLGHEIMRLQKEIFYEIRHKVIYFNTWDLTVATANMNFHPEAAHQIFTTLLGFVSRKF